MQTPRAARTSPWPLLLTGECAAVGQLGRVPPPPPTLPLQEHLLWSKYHRNAFAPSRAKDKVFRMTPHPTPQTLLSWWTPAGQPGSFHGRNWLCAGQDGAPLSGLARKAAPSTMLGTRQRPPLPLTKPTSHVQHDTGALPVFPGYPPRQTEAV